MKAITKWWWNFNLKNIQRGKYALNIYESQDEKTNLDNLINNYKPPIFWKEKPIVKKQLENWTKSKIEKLIFKINETEIFLKKNSVTGLMMVLNFIYETSEKN